MTNDEFFRSNSYHKTSISFSIAFQKIVLAMCAPKKAARETDCFRHIAIGTEIELALNQNLYKKREALEKPDRGGQEMLTNIGWTP